MSEWWNGDWNGFRRVTKIRVKKYIENFDIKNLLLTVHIDNRTAAGMTIRDESYEGWLQGSEPVAVWYPILNNGPWYSWS